MNMQFNIVANKNNFHFKGQLSRTPRTHKLTNNQEMITFPMQNIENGKWFRIAVYDRAIIKQVKKIKSSDMVEVIGVTKKDIWTNKLGKVCSADVFIATNVRLVK
jgi:predicted Zn-dependent protease